MVRPEMEDTQFSWQKIHCIEKSQEPLSPNQRTIQNIPKRAKTVYPKEGAVEIRVCSTVSGIAEIYIYAARKHDGIVEMASGLIKTGAQTVERDNLLCYCVDNMQMENHWLTEPEISNVKDGWSRIMFRTHGYHRVFARVKFQSGTWYVDMVGLEKW